MSYTILSFCGGGIRGLASVTMLNALYTHVPNIVSGANMLAGTSTGAGIVAGLATGQTPPQLIHDFLTKEAIFFAIKKKSASEPAYDVAEVAKSVHKTYGNQQLYGLYQNVLLTSFNVGDTATNTPWEPILFHNFPKSPNGDPLLPETGATLLADAVVSSGAMPGMFGSYQGNVDGAFVNHDPTLAAIALAVNSGISLTDIVVICFGTGFMANSLAGATATWGAQQWQAGDPDASYPENVNVPPLLINGSISPILNISLNGTSTNLIPMLAGMMLSSPQLPRRYAYLNPILEYFIAENDTKPADLKYLQDQAAAVNFDAAEDLVRAYWPK